MIVLIIVFWKPEDVYLFLSSLLPLFIEVLIFCYFSFNLHILSCKGQGYNSIIPTVPDDVSGDSHDLTKKLADKVSAYLDQYIEAMEKVDNPPFQLE